MTRTNKARSLLYPTILLLAMLCWPSGCSMIRGAGRDIKGAWNGMMSEYHGDGQEEDTYSFDN